MTKLKNIVASFAGLMIYTAIILSLSYVIKDAILLNIIAGLIVIILGAGYYNVVMGHFGDKIIVSKKFILAFLGVIVIFSIIGWFTSNLIVARFEPDYLQTQRERFNDSSLVLYMLSMFIIAPIVEELIFRGCMYRFLSQVNKPVAFIVSSVVFAMTHGTIVHMYLAVIGGLILCCVYEKTHSLCMSIMAHSIYNILAFCIGLVPYRAFSSEIAVAVFLNIVLAALIVMLFMMRGAVKIIPLKKNITDEQKRERELTAKAVDEVMAEYKNRR